MFYSFDWTDLHVDIPGKPPSSIARWTKILFFFLPTSHRDTSAKLRYYLQFTFIYLLLVFVYNDHLFSVVIIGICTYLIFQRSASVQLIICCQSLLTTCCLALFSRLKNVNKAQCPQDFYTKPFQQGTTPSIGTHSVYQMSRLHYVTSASF